MAVNVGLGLKPGQELVMTASLDSVALARRITEHAYRAGASLVTTLFSDDEAALMRYRFAPDASFDHAAKWLYDGMAAAFKSGAARLAIAGGNPALLSNEDPDKVGRANRAVSQAYRPALELITRHEINWTIVASATPAWAAAMFPDDAPDDGAGQAVGRDLRDHAHQHRRSGERMEGARRRIAEARGVHERKALLQRCTIAGREPISGSGLPTIIYGWAAARPRATGFIAFPTCPRKKSSRRRTKTAPTAP